MKLSGIKIVVGEPSEKSTVSRQLSCHVSFTNDWRRHESLVNEQVLYDAAGIARLVSDVLRGLFAEDAATIGTRFPPPGSFRPSPIVQAARLSSLRQPADKA
jgi:hypothetical protein